MTVGGPDRRRVVLVGVVLYAAVASLTRPLTGAAAVAVAVPAAAGLVLAGAPRPAVHHAMGPGARRAAALWAAVVVVGTAWELAAWLRQPAYDVASYAHPTASVLLDSVTGAGVPRFVAWCCWMYVGWRMVRR